MQDWIEKISSKKIFIMSLGRKQKEFEYIFTDIDICGYIDESSLLDFYNDKPVRRMNEVLQLKDYFIIVCEKKEEKRKKYFEKIFCEYKVDFCFCEDLFFTLDYNLQKIAGNREIIICEEDVHFINMRPALLMDTYKHGQKLYGMEIKNPLEFKDWDKYFFVVTVEEPTGIISFLEEKGLSRNKAYIWYLDVEQYGIPKDRKIAFYGCGYVATEILKRQEWNITRKIRGGSELEKCNREKHYVIITGTAYDKQPILKRNGYREIIDFVHWSYIEKMNRWKPSEMLKLTTEAPVLNKQHCNSPFEFAYVTVEGEVYGCIAPWTKFGFGNIKYEECYDVWNSVYARIIRLSIINKTFCFCDKNCYQPIILEQKTKDTKYEMRLYPKTLKPCIDYSCNLFCKSCRNSCRMAFGKELLEKEFMAEKLMESEWLTLAENLNIAGMGEVFFSPIYRRLLYQITEKRNKIQVFSNGILFTRQELKNLVQCYRDIEVEISVDAASKVTYEKLRRGSSWEKLRQNLEYIGQERIKERISLFTINMIVQRENFQEIPEFIRLGKRIHADIIAIRPLMNWGTYSEKEYEEISMISYEEGKVSEELKAVLQNPLLQEKEVEYFWFKERL